MIFVYDRTQTDIDEKTEKAFQNMSDLQRLEDNIDEISTLLGLTFSKVTWTHDDKPMASDYERLKQGVANIKANYNVTSISTPNRPFNTWQKWNDLEKLLYDVSTIFIENDNAKSYCGEFYCGEWGLI